MRRFYRDYDSIHRFTQSLDYHQSELECDHCLKNDQLVSHGNIYKQRSMNNAEKVGKRLFCSNRYGRTGCGRTFQLYVATEIPSFRYGAASLFVFITALLAHLKISEAYEQATGQTEPRNAWRWLHKLMFRLSELRSFLRVRDHPSVGTVPKQPGYLPHLLPTLARLFTPHNNGCFDFQISQQRAFF